jgi:8-oxo-dGTP pyrophosphatase MutT (NUDIX family)
MIKAASLLLLRPKSASFEVLMTVRTKNQTFPKVAVFPGGVYNPLDRDLMVTALRETYEETGICLGTPNATRAQVLNDPALIHTFDLFHCLKWANWITPETMKHRFDTDFYLYIGDAADGTPDNRETLQLLWKSPQEYLKMLSENTIFMYPPQIFMLTELSTINLQDLQDRYKRRQSPKIVPFLPRLVKTLGQGAVMEVNGTSFYIEFRNSVPIVKIIDTSQCRL